MHTQSPTTTGTAVARPTTTPRTALRTGSTLLLGGLVAEYVVTSVDRCFGVDDLEPEVAVLAEPVACVLRGLDVLQLQPGSSVLLFGAGTTGLILTSLLGHFGAGELTVAAAAEIAGRRGTTASA